MSCTKLIYRNQNHSQQIFAHCVLIVLLSVSVNCQNPSPCPDIFSYEPRSNEDDRWYGVLALRTREDLDGVWLKIALDYPAERLGNWFGEATADDSNREFTIRNIRYRLEAGPPVSIRFFIKYDARNYNQIPSVKSIKLNGKTICSEQKYETTTPKLHLSEPKRTVDDNNPDVRIPSFDNHDNIGTTSRTTGFQVYDQNFGKERQNHTSTSSHYGNSQPNNNRPQVNNQDDASPNFDSSQIYDNNRRSSSTSRPTGYQVYNQKDKDNRRLNGTSTSSQTYNHQGTVNNRQPSNRDSSHNIPTTNDRQPANQSGDRARNSNTRNPYNGLSAEGKDPDDSKNDSDSSYGVQSLPTPINTDLDFFPGDLFVGQTSRVQSGDDLRVVITENAACGTVATKARPLLAYGQNTTQGEWPWHVAIYHSQGAALMYTCGGTLISRSHVITAAHCVARPQTNKAIDTNRLAVYLGKYSLKRFGAGTQDREIHRIFIHPRYNYSVYFNDIAILELDRPIELTNFVRPCCLWPENEDSDIEQLIDKSGTVVGWGFDERRQISDTLMRAEMPVVSTVKCIYSNREFFSQFTFEKTYCAGFRNGSTVCNGDSGGGMVFPKKTNSGTVWQLRGIVSVGVALQGQGVCDPSHYIVFTDVAKHANWIEPIIRK